MFKLLSPFAQCAKFKRDVDFVLNMVRGKGEGVIFGPNEQTDPLKYKMFGVTIYFA